MNAGLKSRQFCSVCKEWLEMEIVPTSDGDDDDGVIWYRCPQCQGFLPKLKSALDAEESEEESPASVAKSAQDDREDLEMEEYDSPAAMTEAQVIEGILPEDDEVSDDDDELIGLPETEKNDKPKESVIPAEADPIQEYAAMLAEVDPAGAIPYRPWAEYDVGQCLHHLAWDDCGVVVAKETLPGNRNIVKVYFETAGVIRLIEKAPR